MPHFISDIPDKLRVMLSEAANIFLVIVMIYIFQYIFNSQFSCSCTEDFHFIVVIYIVLIPIILFFILKLIKQPRTKVCGTICCVFFTQIFQLFGICLFWGGFILLDGDLYLCMVTKPNDTQRELPCKKNLTLQELSIITIHKNKSQFCGYISIAFGFIGWWLISNTKVGICCDRCSCQCLKDCDKIYRRKPYYERRYEELLSVETDKHLDEKLQEIAKKRAEGICSKHIAHIEKSEFSKNRTTQMFEDARNAWYEISRPDFHTSDISDNQKPNLSIKESHTCDIFGFCPTRSERRQ